MHAMHDKLDISKMGALYRPLKITAILMILASIALAGIYPFSGFFSKDKILEAAFGSGAYILWGILLLGAFLTAFYSFRLIMLVFLARKSTKKSIPMRLILICFMLCCRLESWRYLRDSLSQLFIILLRKPCLILAQIWNLKPFGILFS